MKIRALANGDVIDVSEETAKELTEAGIYEAVEAPKDAPKKPAKADPLSTKNTPPLARKAK
jgi:hypothetical protein